MATWKDITSHSRGEKDRTPRTWEITLGVNLRVVVTRHISGDGWFLNSSLTGFKSLHTEDIELAKAQALTIVHYFARQIIDEHQE